MPNPAVNRTLRDKAVQRYLSPSKYIDFENKEVLFVAQSLALEAISEQDLVRRCFEFVRDEVRHSSDYKLNPITCKASDVLRHKNWLLLCEEPSSGCFAKGQWHSHWSLLSTPLSW